MSILLAYENDPRDKVNRLSIDSIASEDIAINGIFWCKNLVAERLHPILQDETGLLRLLTNEYSAAYTDLAYNLDMSHGYTNMILESIRAKRISIHGTLSSAACYYSNMLISIGTRVHGAIASLSGGTPCLLTNGDLERALWRVSLKSRMHPNMAFRVQKTNLVKL